ncbi:MAG: hypothetical protein J0H59_02130 [Comamonadaceae bacterium]|nr:hypothetical protein [Comamonadaceae bacterium]
MSMSFRMHKKLRWAAPQGMLGTICNILADFPVPAALLRTRTRHPRNTRHSRRHKKKKHACHVARMLFFS